MKFVLSCLKNVVLFKSVQKSSLREEISVSHMTQRRKKRQEYESL